MLLVRKCLSTCVLYICAGSKILAPQLPKQLENKHEEVDLFFLCLNYGHDGL